MDPEPSPTLIFLDIFQSFTWDSLWSLLVLCLLLLASAMISGAEVAYFSIQNTDLDTLEEGDSRRRGIEDLLDSPKTLLATILIANNFINVGIVVLSAFITSQLFDFSLYPTLGFLVQVVAITFLILLFGEVLPKVYATKNALSFALRMSAPLAFLRKLFYPLSRILVRSTRFIDKRLQKRSESYSVEDLSQALELTHNEDSNDEEQKILEGIVKFGSTNVRQIMKPRMDVICVDEEWDYTKVLNIIVESGYSRIPVYEDNFDQVKGVLYIKDLIPHQDEAESFAWQKLLRPAFFVPENKKIDDLLREFQEKKIHLAIVVDEFGGTSGIVTLEDVIEEIVGEISDEFDDDELTYSKLGANSFVFEGKIHLTDFYRLIQADEKLFQEHAGDADTLAGLVLEIAGKFPEKNEEIAFGDYRFTVEGLDGRRIKQIKVDRLDAESMA